MKFDLELLKEVLAISAPSGNEDDAQNYVDQWITANIPDAVMDIDDKGNLYVTKGQADMYPTFVGHLDDVHDYYQHKTICELNGWLYAMDANSMEQIGTAGDDKVGMYLCLEALRTYDNVKCFFPVEEEWGTIGTRACDISFFDDSQYVIQTDRQRAEDIVVATYGTVLTSKTFNKVAKRVGKKYGYKLCNTGGLTDVVTLKEMGLKVCAINIASGYYNPHSDLETVCIADVMDMISTVAELVTELGTKTWMHKHKKKVSTWDYPMDYGRYGKKSTSYGYGYNAETNSWDEDNIGNQAPKGDVYYCDDCGREHSSNEMVTQELCKECAEWYMGEYNYDATSLGTKLDDKPKNPDMDSEYWRYW